MKLPHKSMFRFAAPWVLVGCASVFHGPVDQEGSSFSSTGAIEARTFSADISMNLLEVAPTPLPEQEPSTVFYTPYTKGRSIASKEESVNSERAVESKEPLLPGSPITTIPENATAIRHKVKPGDTLMKLAYRYTGNVYKWKEIYHANKGQIPNFNRLKHGSVLTIYATRSSAPRPKGTAYDIKWGDTLIKISDWVYGTKRKWKALWQNNRQLIHNPNKIYAGFKLYYRGKSVKQKRPEFRAPASEGSIEAPIPLPLKLNTDSSSESQS